jgi:hypothetical protein
MLARCSVVLRLLTLGTLVVPPVLLSHAPAAYAEDDEEDDEGGEGGEGAEEEEEEAVDKDQPAVTAGGLYTKATYPQSEVERPLTITQQVAEARVGMSFDLSKGVTFETWFLNVRGRYGLSDVLEAQVTANIMAVSPEGSATAHTVGAGVETAIVYDVVDFRGGIEAEITDAKTFINLVVGFPVKYRLKPNIAIIALDRFFIIHTSGDHQPGEGKPTLDVGVGVVFQAAPPLALKVRGDIILPGFDAENSLTIPATAALQFSPSGRLDLGLEFVLGNVKPPEGQGAFDSRAALLYVQARL